MLFSYFDNLYIFLNIKYFKKYVIIVQFHRLIMTFLFSHTRVFHARLNASSGKNTVSKYALDALLS